MNNRLDKEVVKRAAQGRWPDTIYPAANINVEVNGFNRHQYCHICGGTKPFRCDDRTGNGDWICTHCGAGDGLDLLMKVHGWSFPEALEFIAGVIGLSLDGKVSTSPAKREPTRPPAPAYTEDSPNPKTIKMLNVIRRRAQLDDGTVQRYLVSRGLKSAPVNPHYIRLMQEYEPSSKKTLPCMVCPIRNISGGIVGYHKTYLDHDTGGKAQIDNPKRFTPALYDGAYRGCSVWLGRAANKLLICEGIETGLAVREMTGQPVWCALSASMMKNIILPEHTRTVEIWADNDTNQTGQQAAAILAERLRSEGRSVTIYTPPIVGDWLDVLNQRKGAA